MHRRSDARLSRLANTAVPAPVILNVRRIAMRYVLLILIALRAYGADVFPGYYKLDITESNNVWAMVIPEIQNRVPWDRYSKWYVTIQGPNVSGDDFKGDVYREIRRSWFSDSGKIFLEYKYDLFSDSPEDVENPRLSVSIERILQDIIIVDVSYGFSLAGGSFRLVYKFETGDWILKNELGGGTR